MKNVQVSSVPNESRISPWIILLLLAAGTYFMVTTYIAGRYKIPSLFKSENVVQPKLTSMTAQKIVTMLASPAESDMFVVYVSEPIQRLPKKDPFERDEWAGVACKIVKWHSGEIERKCQENKFSFGKLSIETYSYGLDNIQEYRPQMVGQLDSN